MSEDGNRELVMRYVDELANKGNIDVADESTRPDLANRSPAPLLDGGKSGPAALKEAANRLRTAFPNLRAEPELILVERDMVAYLGQISGKQTDELFGFPPSRRRMRVWDVSFFRVVDGKLAERWGQLDVLTMMQQLGLTPGPETPEAGEESPPLGDPARAAKEVSNDVEGHKDVYRRMVDQVVNQGNFDVVDELFHPGYVDHAAPPGSPSGLEGVKAVFGMFRTGFPDVKFNIDLMVGEGPYVATLVHGEGTQTGQFIQFPPSGKHAVWQSVGIFRVEGGQIREHWGIPDLLGLLTQIGVIPPTRAAGAIPE